MAEPRAVQDDPKLGWQADGLMVTQSPEPTGVVGPAGTAEEAPRGSGAHATARGARRRVLALASVAVLLVVAGVTAWFVSFRSDATPTTARESDAAVSISPIAGIPATIVTGSQLARVPGQIAHPMFWAGQRRGMHYELTVTKDGAAYVRYLPAGVPAGSPRSAYVLVATYQDANAFATVAQGGRRAGAVSARASTGAVVEAQSPRSTNAYFAFAGVPLLVEVFDPRPGEAFATIRAGGIQLIR